MAIKERNQNPLIGDTVVLRFYVFNGELADPYAIQSVSIYKMFAEESTPDNPFGRTLITTIAAEDIVKDDVGKYHIDLVLESPTFTQGRFQDEWNLVFEEDSAVCHSPMDFSIFPNAWFTDSYPVIHDFSFDYTPNKITQGSKKYIEISIHPNVPRGTDKQRYYENMAIAGKLYISIEQRCGECVPSEQDLRLIIDREEVINRDGCRGYYFLDTTDMNCGIYDVWFEAELGSNLYVGDKLPLQIYR